MSSVKFSVILCINKANPWLESAILSVLNQTDQEYEVLIAANACADELWDELNRLTYNNSRVKLFRTQIGQLAFNLNYLVNQASGNYLIRMDADDVSLPHRLVSLRNVLEQVPYDILGSAVELIDEEDKVIGRMDFGSNSNSVWSTLQRGTAFCHPAVAIKKSFLIQIRGYLGGLVSEDTDLWLRARRAGANVANIDQILFKYRVHPGQSIRSKTGYAEVSGHWLREFILAPSWYCFKGLSIAVLKVILFKYLHLIKRSRKLQ